MKVRTVTLGLWLSRQDVEDSKASCLAAKLSYAAAFNTHVKGCLESAGFEVQTTRVAMNNWIELLPVEDRVSACVRVDQALQDAGIGFAAAGQLESRESIAQIPRIIGSTKVLSCSAVLRSAVDTTGALEAARAVLAVGAETPNGEGNFRFCVSGNCPPGIPFFPAAYHGRAQPTFAVGLECSDVLVEAFAACGGDVGLAEAQLRTAFNLHLSKVQCTVETALASWAEQNAASEDSKEATPTPALPTPEFTGIDTSMCPSLAEQESIASAYESLSFGSRVFGGAGTLTISALITRALKSTDVRHTGFAGLMLPICEDAGLSRRASEGRYGVNELLLYSSVCGVGLDCVPIPGSTPPEVLAAVFMDVTSMALRLNKPLSCRMFPVPGKQAGETTTFNSPYLHNCKVLPLF